jgi:hypothetical protein
MPVIKHSFAGLTGDPFSNLTVEVTDDKVLISSGSYEKEVTVALTHTETQRLIRTLNKELDRA